MKVRGYFLGLTNERYKAYHTWFLSGRLSHTPKVGLGGAGGQTF